MDSLREALFAQPVDVADLERFYRWSQRESHRAIWDMTLFNLPRPSRSPGRRLLVLGAEFDHLMPASPGRDDRPHLSREGRDLLRARTRPHAGARLAARPAHPGLDRGAGL